ncbi:MAG: hypothetical protein GXP29_08420 [Planctomycetes bacterium]|nr:hypothetical protein [Planctomycetota bacterium]
MLYAAAIFWLVVILLSASGVYVLWVGMVPSRIVNIVLLPGTLAAQLGHVLGLFVTGGTVEGTSLISDDGSAEPKQTVSPKSRIPFVGPLIVGVLPLVVCSAGIFLSVRLLGGPTVDDLISGDVVRALPLGVAAFWDLLRNQIDLMEQMLAVASRVGQADWRAWLFIYLAICLTVRMAPLPGNLRGALIAITALGVVTFLTGLVFEPTRSFVERGWGLLSLTATTLLLLLLLSALIRGGVTLMQVLIRRI